MGLKAALVLVAAGAFLGGGYLAADQLSQASASDAALTFETTIEQQVTVRDHGRTIVKRVPVVRRVFLRPQTAFETRYGTQLVTQRITTPGGVRIVRQRVVKLVPVVQRRVVTVNGKTATVTETKLVPTTTIRTQTQVQTNVVTNQQTVVNQNTITVVNSRTTTQPVTVTETHPETVVVTETLPPETVTETVPVVTVTEPLTVTETVTVPSG